MEDGHVSPELQGIYACGFSPLETRRVLQNLITTEGSVPAGLFINSITALEGLVETILEVDPSAFRDVAIGCNDWDPFAAMLPLDIVMMRQISEKIIEEAFTQLDGYMPDQMPLILVMPSFPGSPGVRPRSS